MKIHSLMEDVTDADYYSEEFKRVLEDHITYLTTNNSRIVIVSNFQNYKWTGDFFGLLNDLKIPKDFHYVVMRMNGITNSTSYKGDLDNIIIPDVTEVENLMMTFQTKNI